MIASHGHESSGVTGADEQRVRVLIADDEKGNIEILRAFLSAQGEIDVVGEARNGKQAVDLAAQLQPDIVLMDYRMPVMNGLEATDIIKQAAQPPAVIMVTMDADGLRGLPPSERGPDAVCDKLEVPTELPSMLKRCLQGRGKADPDHPAAP